MSGISAGIGLISGIDTANLIDQLISLEARPILTLRTRVQQLDTRRAALLEISAQLLAVRNAVTNFNRISFFNRFNANSSNDNIITAIVQDSASPSSTTFRVHSLVSTHSLISRGFADIDTTPVGSGTLTFEIARGKVNQSTDLDVLNGGAGIRRGTITITDRSGVTADIDLTKAVTIDDVLSAINNNTKINVRASVTGIALNGATGDRIVIEDLNNLDGDPEAGDLKIADKNGSITAFDLGIVGQVSADRFDGKDIVILNADTPLSLLNDGNGIDRLRQGNDLTFLTSEGQFDVSFTNILEPFIDLRALNHGRGVDAGVIRITDRAGKSVEVDFTDLDDGEVFTVQDVRSRIKEAADAAGLSLSISMVNSHFQISDTSNVADDKAVSLKIENVTGTTASDLGIVFEEDKDTFISGKDIYSVTTMGDVVRAINYATGNDTFVRASISDDGNSITLRALGFDTTVSVIAGENDDGNTSMAAKDLGLLDAEFSVSKSFQTDPLIAGLNSVLLRTLNGGSGIRAGEISFTDRLGRSATIDFNGVRTLKDVIDFINADDTTSLIASVNSAGNGIEIRDSSGGNGSIVIEDTTGTLASELGLAGTYTAEQGETINGGNLQRQYITENTLVSDLNAGRGISEGVFRITDSTGEIIVINLSTMPDTVGGVIKAINRDAPSSIEARINDTGDGIVIIDTSSGDSALTIEDIEGNRTASDLRLNQTAGFNENQIDGSFEVKVEINAGDTLQDVIRKINSTNAGVSASILNDGGEFKPFSLTVTSDISGRRGEMIIDSGMVDLGFNTLARAQDAVVTMGESGSSTPLLITSSSNTLENTIDGVTFNLLSVSDEDVTISVGQDMDGIVGSIQNFVERYNAALDSMDNHTRFDPESLDRGVLFGDPTIDILRSRMSRTILRPVQGVDDSVERLFNVGLRLRSGRRLEFDEERFRQRYADNPEIIEDLFTHEETGFGQVVQDMLDGLTQDFDGVITRKDQLLTDQKELLNDRIDDLNILLEAKRARLEAQFVGLESALASLQRQQASLGSLSQLANGFG